eukprot:1056856-Prymnesium_polylepis.1
MSQSTQHHRFKSHFMFAIDHAQTKKGGIRLRGDAMYPNVHGSINSITHHGTRRRLGLSRLRQRQYFADRAEACRHEHEACA